MKVEDIESIMSIWFSSTVVAHPFIALDYWEKNYNIVKDIYLPNAKTSVFEEGGMIKGFISIIDDSFIGALFVDNAYQGQGIGQSLINTAINQYKSLSLAVYKDNVSYIHFYEKQGFKILCEQVNEDSGYMNISCKKGLSHYEIVPFSSIFKFL